MNRNKAGVYVAPIEWLMPLYFEVPRNNHIFHNSSTDLVLGSWLRLTRFLRQREEMINPLRWCLAGMQVFRSCVEVI